MPLNKGDRVRVEFEAVVINPSDCDGDVEMRVEGSPYPRWANPAEVTVIEPEYEEGEMYVDADGDFFFYSPRTGSEGRPWFAPGAQREYGTNVPTAPLRKLVPES